MRAAVFHKAGRPLTIENVPDPEPADDQIIIEVAYCGICGSDLHVTQYGFAQPGTILGHEFSGIVVETGKAARGSWKIGDRVTALPFNPCSMHTGTVTLSELPAAFEALRADSAHCKLLIEPGRP